MSLTQYYDRHLYPNHPFSESLEKVLILLICIAMIRPEIFFLHILRDNPDGSGKRINTRANLIDLFVVLCI